MATKYFMSGGVSSNWSDDTNWSTTASSGPNNTTHAVSGDAVILDSGSPNCILNTASASTSIVCTGYTGTLTGSGNLTVGGTVTFVSGMTISATGTLTIGAAATITSGGNTWPGKLTLGVGSSITITLGDNWTVAGLLTTDPASSGALTINGSQITLLAGLTLGGGSSANTTGSTTIIMAGTGTVTSSAGILSTNFTINTTGTITFASTTFEYRTGTFTYLAGTVVASSTTLSNTSSAPASLAIGSGIVWQNITLSLNSTYTLGADLYCSGLLKIGPGGSNNVIVNGGTIYSGGGFTLNCATGGITGTAAIVLTGTGSLQGISSTTTGRCGLAITVNAPGSTITIGPFLFNMDISNFWLEAGAVVSTPGTWAGGSSGGSVNRGIRTGGVL